MGLEVIVNLLLDCECTVPSKVQSQQCCIGVLPTLHMSWALGRLAAGANVFCYVSFLSVQLM